MFNELNDLHERVLRLERATLEPVTIKLKRLPHCLTDEPPQRSSEKASGADIRAALERPVTLPPGSRTMVPTGLQIADVPPGYEIQVRPRSGLAAKHGITIVNTPGTVDEDYRGELKVILINLGKEPFIIEPNERIGQLVVARRVDGAFEWSDEITETGRGDGGFGSTGRL